MEFVEPLDVVGAERADGRVERDAPAGEDRDAVGHGEAAAEAEFWPVLMGKAEPPAPPPEPEEERRGTRGLFGTVRRRLRGRVDDELRRWIELAAARTGRRRGASVRSS